MPVDASIALHAGQTTNPLGEKNAIPNLLANPQALNALLTMSGKVAAGRAMQQAIGPDGTLDFGKFSSIVANDPQAAPYVLEAMNQGLDASGKQIKQQIEQRQEATKAISGLLLNPAFRGQQTADEAQKLFRETLTGLHKQGSIDSRTVATAIEMMPTIKGTGQMDVVSTKREMLRAMISLLPPDQMQKAMSGQTFMVDSGDKMRFLNINPITNEVFETSDPITYGERQSVKSAPRAGEPDPRTQAKREIPASNLMPQGGASVSGDIRGEATPGLPMMPPQRQQQQQTAPQSSRYSPSMFMSRFLAEPTLEGKKELARKYRATLTDEQAKTDPNIKAVEDWITKQRGRK